MEDIKAEFKIQGYAEKCSVIEDYRGYKIQFLMKGGMWIKFFKLHNNKWYKLREQGWTYLELNNAIVKAKNYIDNFEMNLINKLEKLVNNRK